MLQFPNIDPDAVRVLSFNAINQLNPDEVLQGGVTIRNLVCTAGVDLNPQGMVIGPPSYDVTGIRMLIPVAPGQSRNGNDYEFEVVSLTNQPPKQIVGRALLSVRIA